MIVAVAALKHPGGAGVTTLAWALASVLAGRAEGADGVVVLEADPSGGEAALVLRGPRGQWLAPEPTLLSLAADARAGFASRALAQYGQPSWLGVPVIAGPATVEGFAPIARMWEPIAEAAAAWPGVVVADLGRLAPGHPVVPLLAVSAVTLLLVPATLPGFYRLRERIGSLAAAPGGERLAVVVRAGAGQREAALREVRELLDSVGSPVPVLGVILDDPAGAAGVAAGRLAPSRFREGLVRSTGRLLDVLSERLAPGTENVGRR